jgi:quercetin dioxygenase-like cupin family protein
MGNYAVKNIEPVVVGADAQARVFTLARREVIPWHFHGESTDHYFVLRGTLTIETQRPNERHTLAAGERFKILPGTAHRISNELETDCEFLLVQGVGKYDWHKAQPPE